MSETRQLIVFLLLVWIALASTFNLINVAAS